MSTKSVSLARERSQATSEERMVLALEMIADQLRLIAESLAVKERGEVHGVLEQTRTAASDRRAGDRWENEGGPAKAG
jgi:signal transduction protein with GAF and PtsI domain